MNDPYEPHLDFNPAPPYTPSAEEASNGTQCPAVLSYFILDGRTAHNPNPMELTP